MHQGGGASSWGAYPEAPARASGVWLGSLLPGQDQAPPPWRSVEATPRGVPLASPRERARAPSLPQPSDGASTRLLSAHRRSRVSRALHLVTCQIEVFQLGDGLLHVHRIRVLEVGLLLLERNNYWLQNVFGCHLIAQYFVILLV